jgi:hypothetical protein
MNPVLLIGLLTASCLSAATVVVDPRDPAAFSTLRDAAATLRPGDTLQLAPGSGPYREELYIQTGGTAEAPIVVEGNGNEVTGFEPFAFPGGKAAPPVPYPFLLRHHGQRVAEDAPGSFGGKVIYDAENHSLSLTPGTAHEGWEISARKFAVRILNASHQIYRNLRASGSLNDGFNLHGKGEGLVFEKITGCQNLDEGFSAHGSIQCTIRGGGFFENDNGLLSGQQTVTSLEGVDLHHNLGLGLGFNGQAVVQARNVRVWGNGLVQLLLRKGVAADFQNVQVFKNPHAARPWLTYCETAGRGKPLTIEADASFVWPEGSLQVSESPAPPES